MTTPAIKTLAVTGGVLLLGGGLWWTNRPPTALDLAKRVPTQILEGDVRALCEESAESDRPWPCGDPQAEARFGAWIRNTGHPAPDQAISAAFSSALSMRCTRRKGEVGPEAMLRAMEENRTSLENMGLMGFPRAGGQVRPWDEEIARQKIRVAMVKSRETKPIGG